MYPLGMTGAPFANPYPVSNGTADGTNRDVSADSRMDELIQWIPCFDRQNACISSIFYVSYFPQTTLSSLSSLFTHTCPVTVFILPPQHCFFRLLSLCLCYNVHISLLILYFEHTTARTYFHSYPSIMMTKYVNI